MNFKKQKKDTAKILIIKYSTNSSYKNLNNQIIINPKI